MWKFLIHFLGQNDKYLQIKVEEMTMCRKKNLKSTVEAKQKNSFKMRAAARNLVVRNSPREVE